MNNLPDGVTDEMYEGDGLYCLDCDEKITEDEFVDNDGRCDDCVEADDDDE